LFAAGRSEGKKMEENQCECGGDCDCGNDAMVRLGPWLWSAYRAHNDLLRDKLKAKFEKEEGPWLDKMADLLVQWVNVRWEGGRKAAEKEKAIRAKLDKLLDE
jgi:hypothetical protein